MQHSCYRSRITKKLTADEAALAALIPSDEREEFDRAVAVLVARNRVLEVLERERHAQNVSKRELAERAGLDYASVRRLLTADTANPTTETMIRLFSALDIRVSAALPSGDVVELV